MPTRLWLITTVGPPDWPMRALPTGLDIRGFLRGLDVEGVRKRRATLQTSCKLSIEPSASDVRHARSRDVLARASRPHYTPSPFRCPGGEIGRRAGLRCL